MKSSEVDVGARDVSDKVYTLEPPIDPAPCSTTFQSETLLLTASALYEQNI